MKSINVSARHIDTCLSCYLTDFHHSDGELLIGIEPHGQSVDEAIEEAIYEIAALDHDGSVPEEGKAFESALRDALTGVDLRAINDNGDRVAVTSPADDDDSSDRAQVWILLTWEAV